MSESVYMVKKFIPNIVFLLDCKFISIYTTWIQITIINHKNHENKNQGLKSYTFREEGDLRADHSEWGLSPKCGDVSAATSHFLIF